MEEEVQAAAVLQADGRFLYGLLSLIFKNTVFMTKKTMIILAAAAAVALWGITAYNGIVTAEENVESKWGNVQNVYQRRADLIPNLVAIVKGYAAHEKSTLEAVTDARTRATQLTVNVDDLTPEKLREFQKTQGELSTALGRLIAITENYPDLKANQNFLELQAQLEGTENRINVERKNFNEAAQSYNTKIRRFPTSILASIFGFDKKPYFEAEAGSENAPKITF
jgi:LemA protein